MKNPVGKRWFNTPLKVRERKAKLLPKEGGMGKPYEPPEIVIEKEEKK